MTTATQTNEAVTVGKKLAELCRQGKHLEAVKTLYAKDIVSTEACEAPGMERQMRGLDKIRGKNEWFLNAHTIHSSTVAGPFPHGEDRFCLYFKMDATAKEGPRAGERITHEEVGLYTVKNGKIAREEFFYGGM